MSSFTSQPTSSRQRTGGYQPQTAPKLVLPNGLVNQGSVLPPDIEKGRFQQADRIAPQHPDQSLIKTMPETGLRSKLEVPPPGALYRRSRTFPGAHCLSKNALTLQSPALPHGYPWLATSKDVQSKGCKIFDGDLIEALDAQPGTQTDKKLWESLRVQ